MNKPILATWYPPPPSYPALPRWPALTEAEKNLLGRDALMPPLAPVAVPVSRAANPKEQI